MASLLSSYRFRRRLLKGGVLLAVAGGLAVVAIVFWNTGRTYDTPRSTEPAVEPEQRQNVRLTPVERSQALRTAARFVQTAVSRTHLDEAYDLTHPDLRQGLTRRQWDTGTIPVQYYPVDSARWRLDYQYADEIGLQVYVLPKRGETLQPMVFDMALKPLTVAGGRRWLVSSWAPRASSNGQAAPASSERLAAPAPVTGRGSPVSAVWLFLPLFLIGAALVVPLGLAVRNRRRARRIEREHRAALAQRSRARQEGS